jgi:hypothetical protein
LDAQAQRVPDEVGDILYLRNLVIVGQDDSLALRFQFLDLLDNAQCKTFLTTPSEAEALSF